MIADTRSDVRLVVADVDGTLVTPDKILTPHARAAVRHIIEAGIAFTITSGRPPLGMKMLIDDLQLREPITAFNGGLFVRPERSVIRQRLVPRGAAPSVIDILSKGCSMSGFTRHGLAPHERVRRCGAPLHTDDL